MKTDQGQETAAARAAAPVVRIDGLTKRFGPLTAVDDFSIEVARGDVFAFLGSNGSGKTTTFRCLLGIYAPTSGTVELFGTRFSAALAPRIGYLPEERGIYTKTSVRDTLSYFASLRGLSGADRAHAVAAYLERVGLAAHADKKINQLSSGMQQKVQLGTALIHSPELLILDEPFKGLDPVNRQSFLDMFSELREQGTTILYSTHVVDEVSRLANRLVMIKDGRRVLYGGVDAVRDQFGTENIRLSYTGRLPERPDLFTARTELNAAELTPQPGVTPETIVRALIATDDLELREFAIDRPSLNSIFIEVAKAESAPESAAHT
ncbi:ATP-binding cassette domain-containing protein [Patescibacteria group bacterium]|nr:ATP-binding cassette domain-containing protein [Patescibacteria group bacterium]